MILSRLESLPAELFQPIFFYCVNVNLPLCSHIIGTKLSNPEAFQVATMDHLVPLAPTGKRNSDANSPAYKILASKYMTFTCFKVFFHWVPGVGAMPVCGNMLVRARRCREDARCDPYGFARRPREGTGCPRTDHS